MNASMSIGRDTVPSGIWEMVQVPCTMALRGRRAFASGSAGRLLWKSILRVSEHSLVVAALAAVACLFGVSKLRAGEQRIVLREYLDREWKHELLTHPFSAPQGECHPDSINLIGPHGATPVQLSEIVYWPGTRSVKSAKLAFIADLSPLAIDNYTVRYDTKPAARPKPATDLAVAPGTEQVEITTSQFGVRLLEGEKSYPEPVPSADVPGPIIGMRLADGTWFGGSRMFGAEKIVAYSAKLTDSGPVFARAAIGYTYANGNTMDLTVQVAAGDNAMRMETRVRKHQLKDGFQLILNRGLPPLIFQVQDERRKDRPCFMNVEKSLAPLKWAEIPLDDYVAPAKYPPGLVTRLTPWEDWFGTFTQARIRLKLAGTERELQIRSLEPGAWVEPRPIESVFDPSLNPDPAKGIWVGWNEKCMPLIREASGEVFLEVNAAQGVRKWTISDCLSMPGVAALFSYYGYKSESTFPPETRPTVGYHLNEVKDYVLDWPGDEGRHPRLYISRSELEQRWKRKDADPAVLDELMKNGSAPSPEHLAYVPNWGYQCALGAYLLTGSAEIAQKTQLAARVRKALDYDIWGVQFGSAGNPPTFYDALIDSPLVSDKERPVLRARMAYFAYRLNDPAVWSAERGYCSGNANMTVTWEIPRGIAACTIAEHPMAKTWYRKAERIMELFLDQMVGPAGEWPEAMSHHGRTSINMLLAFAIASTNSGLHDYVNDPRVKRLMMYWAKLETPRDPRPRGHYAFAAPNLRYFPAMGRDSIGVPGGTSGAVARATRTSDPAYSAQLQWAWLEEGASSRLSHLGGFAFVACDKRLPSKTPDWPSEVFPRAGAVLRHGLGTPNEHQVILYSGDHSHAFYPGHTGGFASIFAYGTPVAGLFPGGYEYQESYLTSSVDLARGLESVEARKSLGGYHGCATRASMWSWPKEQPARFGERGGRANVSEFSTLPRQDYVAVDVARHFPRALNQNVKTDLPDWPEVPNKGKPPVDWRRQTLFVKDDDPAKTAYLLIRDTIKGGQPTTWQMWTVSETVDTPEKVGDVAAVLANRPGHKILPARELTGDRFTAIGQLGVDVEYYIASPSDTPRHTLRWGTDMFDWANRLAEPEYQDLLHLQMPGDGAYFVAFFPRRRTTPAPAFSTLGNGTIIKVSGDFGTDYGFLSAFAATASGEETTFRGTAASVQDRQSGLVLTLGAKGHVGYKQYRLAADFPAALRIEPRQLTIELPLVIQPPAFELSQPFPGGKVTVNAPGSWVLSKPLPGVKLTRSAAGFVLEVPPGLKAVTVVEGKTQRVPAIRRLPCDPQPVPTFRDGDLFESNQSPLVGLDGAGADRFAVGQCRVGPLERLPGGRFELLHVPRRDVDRAGVLHAVAGDVDGHLPAVRLIDHVFRVPQQPTVDLPVRVAVVRIAAAGVVVQ